MLDRIGLSESIFLIMVFASFLRLSVWWWKGGRFELDPEPLEPECPTCGGAHTPYCR